MSGIEVCARRSEAFDRAVRELAEPAAADDVAVVAVGGYGRREMCPGSDVDLLFLHDRGADRAIDRLVDAVLYPLWDSGVRVSHAVGTVEDVRRRADDDLPSLTSLLEARPLAGSAALVESAKAGVRSLAAGDPARLLKRLEADRRHRGERFPRLGWSLGADLRDSLGGLRDVQFARWVRMAEGRPRDEAVLHGAGDLLLLVRTALHRVAGLRSNVLAAEHDSEVAAVIGIVDETGWEAGDVLARSVAHRARQVDALWREGGLTDASGLQGRAGLLAALDEAPEPLLDLDARTGFLTDVVPEWEMVRGRPQRDPFHRYHVDVHLIRTVADVGRLLREPDEPFAMEAADVVSDRAPLLLGALLHDIGKVGKGTHVPLGVSISERVLDRIGVEGDLREDVLFLVGEHLLLSDTATRKNLEDEDLILHVAARVGDPRRLALLYLLTVADARATGPNASTPWRIGLVRDLVAKVQRSFDRGLMDADRAERLEHAMDEIRAAALQLPEADVERFVETVPPGYLLWVDPTDVRAHIRLIVPRPDVREIRTDVRPGSMPATFRLMVGAVDRLGLLASIAGALSLAGLSIVSAHAFTTEEGLALDAFDVRGAYEEVVGPERWVRFHRLVRQALEGELDLEERIRTARSHYRPAATAIPVTVEVDQETSDFWTILEVGAADRLGLLFDLARTLAAFDLDVHSAKVATYGPRVIDVFYVTDGAGQKVADERIPELEAALRDALVRSSGRERP